MPQASPPDLDELYRRLAPRLLVLAHRLTGNRAAAEDVLHEAFVSAHRFLAGFRSESTPDTWLYRIVIRAAGKHLARARRERAKLQQRGTTASAEESGSQKDAEAVLLAMKSLTPEHRLVLSLLSLRGLGSGQVAEILGIPEGTVWSRASAARRALRGRFEP